MWMLASSTLTGRCSIFHCGKELPQHAGREHRPAARAVAGEQLQYTRLRALQDPYAVSYQLNKPDLMLERGA
jgi:hypothetical protein